MGNKIMSIIDKIDMFLLSEGAVRLTAYAKSAIRLQDDWTKEELDKIVGIVGKNNTDKFTYEITFNKGKNKDLVIYRRHDSVIKRNMKPEDIDTYKKDVESLLKGTGMKIVGNSNAADWMSFIIA